MLQHRNKPKIRKYTTAWSQATLPIISRSWS